jgi:dephospho-CoA kinase
MIKVGITGGIGSGKSVVCNIFRSLGIPFYDADSRAKILMNENRMIQRSLTNYFGNEVYNKGTLDKVFLAQKIFNNGAALDFVNNVVHPAVKSDFIHWAGQQENAPYVIEEAALLFESKSYKELDYVITVTCPEELRIQRVMDRDKTTRDKVEERIKNQLPESEKANKSDFVVVNNDRESLIEQINKIHLKIITR